MPKKGKGYSKGKMKIKNKKTSKKKK